MVQNEIAFENGNRSVNGDSDLPLKLQRVRLNKASILALVERQGRKCALTGWTLTPATASLDHIVPLVNGGEHAIENTQMIHREVNRAKGTMSNEEFVKMCRAVAEFAGQKFVVPP